MVLSLVTLCFITGVIVTVYKYAIGLQHFISGIQLISWHKKANFFK